MITFFDWLTKLSEGTAAIPATWDQQRDQMLRQFPQGPMDTDDWDPNDLYPLNDKELAAALKQRNTLRDKLGNSLGTPEEKKLWDDYVKAKENYQRLRVLKGKNVIPPFFPESKTYPSMEARRAKRADYLPDSKTGEIDSDAWHREYRRRQDELTPDEETNKNYWDAIANARKKEAEEAANRMRKK